MATTFLAPHNQRFVERKEGLWLVEYRVGTTPWVIGDSVVFMGANRYGWQIGNWFISAEQLDSNVAPTLAYDIGYLNPGGTAMEANGTLKSGCTVGRGGTPYDLFRADNGLHLYNPLQPRRIGLLVTAAAATWAGTATKKIRMGFELASL